METIIIVDDDVNILKVAQMVLQDAGYYVHVAENASTALMLFKQKGADLVISDLCLPDFSGSRLIDLVHACNKETRCVLMSGTADSGLRDHKPMYSEDYFLCKPFDIDELTEAVLTCLRTANVLAC